MAWKGLYIVSTSNWIQMAEAPFTGSLSTHPGMVIWVTGMATGGLAGTSFPLLTSSVPYT